MAESGIRKRLSDDRLIAHRLSTIRHCDRIFVLDKGRVAGQGTHDELVNQEGLFRDLVLCQNAAQPA